MLESLPEHSLIRLQKGWVDMPDMMNADPVREVYFFIPDDLPTLEMIPFFHAKCKQFQEITDFRGVVNKRIEREGGDYFLTLPDAAKEWYRRTGKKFSLKHRLLGLESGFVFHRNNGNAEYVSNHYVCNRGELIDFHTMFEAFENMYEQEQLSNNHRRFRLAQQMAEMPEFDARAFLNEVRRVDDLPMVVTGDGVLWVSDSKFYPSYSLYVPASYGEDEASNHRTDYRVRETATA